MVQESLESLRDRVEMNASAELLDISQIDGDLGGYDLDRAYQSLPWHMSTTPMMAPIVEGISES
jgi:hypothetical protein